MDETASYAVERVMHLELKVPLGKLQGLQEAAALRDLNCREEGKLSQVGKNGINPIVELIMSLTVEDVPREKVVVNCDGEVYTKCNCD